MFEKYTAYEQTFADRSPPLLHTTLKAVCNILLIMLSLIKYNSPQIWILTQNIIVIIYLATLAVHLIQ